MIVSSDTDFLQLHQFNNVKQYSPIHKRFLSHDNPKLYLKEKILKGDPGDGIPNFLSDADTFVVPGKRQKPLRQKTLSEHMSKEVDLYEDRLKSNFERNKVLIDLVEHIPAEIEENVLSEYENQHPKNNVLDYFIKNKLRNLMPSLMEF
jgi:ribosomal protein S17E